MRNRAGSATGDDLRRTGHILSVRATCFALSLAITTSFVSTPAFAQWPFDFFRDPTPTATVERPALRRPRVQPEDRALRFAREDRVERSRPSLLPAISTGRVALVVSTDHQTLTVFDDGVPIAQTTVSTGVADHPTPHGIFSVIEKQRYHESNIYSAAPMPYMQRITWSGVALHEGHVTGRPASHGCIRLPRAFASDLFRYTRNGARVIVAREAVLPTPTAIPSIFIAAATQHDADAPPLPDNVEISARPRGTAAVDGAVRAGGPQAPISILVSRKAGKLFVRRAGKPLLTVPIAIDDAARPLGTHMFMAGANPVRDWSAMTLNAPILEASILDNATRSRRMRDVPAVPLAPSTSWEALARLHLAPGTASFLASMLTPGATLILSDDGARGRETWEGTNFIALSE